MHQSRSHAEAQRAAAIKEAANAAAKSTAAQGAALSGQVPQEPSGAHVALAPAQEGQGLQQTSQACRPHCALREFAGPAGGVPAAQGPEGRSLCGSCKSEEEKEAKKERKTKAL